MKKFKGLTQQEAQQKLKEFGFNEIQEKNKTSALQILIRQAKKNFVIYLLGITAILSFFLGEAITGYVILVVVTIVITTGFIQEFKAEKALSSLRNMIMPVTRVIRDGEENETPSKELVPGDYIVLRTGEKIPADCIVLEASNLKTNESILTGEPEDIVKTETFSHTSYSNENVLYMGSFVVSGRCVAQVIQTGMKTKFGHIASMISSAEKKLPLQEKVNTVSKYMVGIGIAAAIITGIVLFYRAETVTFELSISILIVVIALAVSSFPEGFPVVLTATLAYGVNRMAKQNAIVNRMSIIETLGETSVICSDKTGTLTKGEMTVRKILTNGTIFDIGGVGFEAKGSIFHNGKQISLPNNESVQKLLQCAVICNDSNIERSGSDDFYKVIGSATEGALLILGAKFNLFRENFPNRREEEMPFDSKRKMMSVLYDAPSAKIVYAKGAPDILLKQCISVQEGNEINRLSESDREDILNANKKLTSQGFRTIALAYKLNGEAAYKEDSFIFLGIVGMEDPPREEVAEAIALCKQSGIKVKMITGDDKATAQAIANEIGITGDILTGLELKDLSDEELINNVGKIAIFARVQPEDKLRIVKALKANNEIVTMTGDGVNDAPALKEAHIGVAMGINGTDVSRSVADITLKDDNFATIVIAIKEGRTIFNNIRKFVTYQLACNFSDIYILFTGMIVAPYLGWYTPILTALQILFMNIVTDDMPAITLGFNKTSKDIMQERPRKNAQILTGEFFNLLILNGVTMGIIAFCVSYLSFNILRFPPEVARTTILVSMIFVQIANAYNFRSFRYCVLNRGLLVNKYLFWASLLSILATLSIIYTPLREVFETTALGHESWLIAIGAALTIVIMFDVQKIINNRTKLFLHHVH
ncbi:MAG: cation-translocating P-type ATPase [Candidatus Levyibacteriota bacterium]